MQLPQVLREYDLTLQDIPAEQKKKDPIEIVVVPFKCMHMNFTWYCDLLITLAKYNNARILLSRSYNTSDSIQEVFYKVVGRRLVSTNATVSGLSLSQINIGI